MSHNGNLFKLLLPVVACGCLYAQAENVATRVIPRDAIRPRVPLTEDMAAAIKEVPLWKGAYQYKGKSYSYLMVGTDPAKGSVTTTVPVFIVPLKLTFSDGTVFDATAPMIGLHESATQAVEMSPIFQPVSWTEGSIDVGSTQYIDAFQRANFWSSVSTQSPNYHVLLGVPTVLPLQSYNVPASAGSTMPGPVPGTKRATVNNAFLDKVITPDIFSRFPQITSQSFTIFLDYNVFPGGAYGFHDVWRSSPGKGNTYTYVSYLEPYTQVIDADISTLAHEVAEWVDDPVVNNSTPCGILEVGDPLSSVIFDVQLNGMVWHPQDLVFAPWFTYQPSFSVNGWLTFKNSFTTACKT